MKYVGYIYKVVDIMLDVRYRKQGRKTPIKKVKGIEIFKNARVVGTKYLDSLCTGHRALYTNRFAIGNA